MATDFRSIEYQKANTPEASARHPNIASSAMAESQSRSGGYAGTAPHRKVFDAKTHTGFNHGK